jgi:hypothetical protein
MGLFATGGMSLSAWIALRWGFSWEQIVHEWIPDWIGFPANFSPAWLAAILFGFATVFLLALALRPAVEIHDRHLKVGRRQIAWNSIRRLDQTGWRIPLAVNLTLRADDGHETRLLLVHAGDAESCDGLLRYLRRYSREALLDGIPYRQFWGEPSKPAPKQLPPPRYQLLLPDEEEEVERMFQRLKTVGHFDQRGSEEK